MIWLVGGEVGERVKTIWDWFQKRQGNSQRICFSCRKGGRNDFGVNRSFITGDIVQNKNFHAVKVTPFLLWKNRNNSSFQHFIIMNFVWVHPPFRTDSPEFPQIAVHTSTSLLVPLVFFFRGFLWSTLYNLPVPKFLTQRACFLKITFFYVITDVELLDSKDFYRRGLHWKSNQTR